MIRIANEKLNTARSIWRLVNEDIFFNYYLKSDPNTQKEIENEVENLQLEKLKQRHSAIKGNFKIISFDMLRRLAKERNIANYSRMNKQELLIALKGVDL